MNIEKPWPKPSRDSCHFYHEFDLPNGENIGGVWRLEGKFDEYIGHVSLAGKTVFDLGTATGFLAFSAERAGATRVVAHELDALISMDRIPFKENLYVANKKRWSDQGNEGLNRQKRAFWYMWHTLGSSVEVHYGSIQGLLSEEERFDVVIAGAIIEHLADPVTALGACCRLAKETVIVGFTPVVLSEEKFMKPLTPWDDPLNDYTWWLLSSGLYDTIFANMGFTTTYLPCTIDYQGQLVPRFTIVANRIKDR